MDSDEERIVAVLHDTVEDSSTDLEDLRRAGFSEAILSAVAHLTKSEGESYEAFVDRLSANPIARRVKLADIEDNMNIRRMDTLSEKDLARLQRYHRAWKKLAAPGMETQD